MHDVIKIVWLGIRGKKSRPERHKKPQMRMRFFTQGCHILYEPHWYELFLAQLLSFLLLKKLAQIMRSLPGVTEGSFAFFLTWSPGFLRKFLAGKGLNYAPNI